MIKSCKDCKTPCCRMGLGPHRLVTPDDYLENFESLGGYNTQCMALDDKTHRCRIWGTKSFPAGCRAHVCTVRSFTKAELAAIESVCEDIECAECDAEYVLRTEDVDERGEIVYVDTCDACGHVTRWGKI